MNTRTLRLGRIGWSAVLVGVLAHAAPEGQSPKPAAPAPPASQSPAAKAPAAPAVTALTDTGWPRDVMSGQTKITIYQPQIDTWDGFKLAGRAAVAVTEKPDTPPIYGIIDIRAEAHIDKDERVVSLEKITIESAAFPSVDADKGRQWALAVQARATKMRPMSLERFEAAVAVSAAARKGDSVPVKNEPPVVHVSKVPAMLILVDGNPVYRDVSGTPLTRVLNTRPLILKDAEGKHYLKVFDGWMSAAALAGPWTVTASVPGDVDKALKAVIELKVADLLVGGDPNDPASAPSLKKTVPQIFVDTKPAELIVFEGEPKYVPLEGTQLMYAENTTGNMFVYSADQMAYMLVSGRWFRGPSTLQDPWEFVAAESLPKDFPAIPDSSRWAGEAGRAYNSRTGVAAAGQRGVVGNVYSGNYAAGSRGAAVNTRTGTAAAGRTGTIGNAYTGNEVKAGQGVVRGPGGNTTRVGGVKGEDGGAMRVGDDVFAGRDGNVYKHNDGGGWDQMTRPEPRSGQQAGQFDRSQLDRERTARSNGNYRTGAARSGGYHGGMGGGRMRGGGRRR